MKIAFIVEHCHKRGGHERTVAELAERLSLGHEVHIFANSCQGVNLGRVRFHRVPMVPKPSFPMLASFIAANSLMVGRRQYEIVHSQGPNALRQNVITVQTVARARNEQLGTFTVPGREDWVRRSNDRLYYWFVYAIERHIYSPHSRRKVICVSEGIRREVAKYFGKPPHLMAVVPNGVDLETFHPRHRLLYRTGVRRALGLEEGDFALLFVGGDWGRKGLETGLQALALLKRQDVKLVVVGRDAPEPYLRLAQKLGVLGQVVLAGPSPTPEKYYAMADAFLLPSRYEAFSLASLEAAAAGLPLLVTRVNGTEELVQEGFNGHFIASPGEAAHRIRALMEDPHLLRSLGEGAHQSAAAYSWDSIAQRVEQIYREVVKA